MDKCLKNLCLKIGVKVVERDVAESRMTDVEGFKVLKKLIESNRVDELVKIFSYLEGKQVVTKSLWYSKSCPS